MILNFLLSTLLLINTINNNPTKTEVSSNGELNISILTAANSWVYNNPDETDKIITKAGITNWSNPKTKIRTYFRTDRIGEIQIGLNVKINHGNSRILVSLNGISKELSISNTNLEDIFVGTFTIDTPGYQYIELQGIKKSESKFAEVPEILIGGEATEGKLHFVKDDIYWGRRGPSVHLSYEKPESASDIVWFYNEMTIPEGKDKIGSYFMASGFGQGYFGIQVNSETERRVLFSVWSAFTTDDPNQIPTDYKVEKLANGKNVKVQDFGNEGSGLQCIRKYNWKAGVTYKFLLKAIPSENNSTDYTAYFYAPEIGEWELMASLRRPKTSTYLTRPHSFLENFIPSMGDQERKVIYKNQWVYDSTGSWHKISRAKFTADATARKESRLDYSGGSEDGKFYLQNCGFFSKNTTIDSFFNLENNAPAPKIDFDLLTK